MSQHQIDLFITSLAFNRSLFQNCVNLKNALHSKNIPFNLHDVAKDKEKLSEMMKVSGSKKLPQVHVNGASLGEYDMVVDWIEENCLGQALRQAGWDGEREGKELGGVSGDKQEVPHQDLLPKKISFPPNLDVNQDVQHNESAPSLEELKQKAQKRREAQENDMESDTDDELGSPLVDSLEEDNPWKVVTL